MSLDTGAPGPRLPDSFAGLEHTLRQSAAAPIVKSLPVDSEWSSNIDSCDAGDTRAAFKAASLRSRPQC